MQVSLRTHSMGMDCRILGPQKIAKPLEAIIPRVLPKLTKTTLLYFAPSATVTSCVLSPISARKNETNVIAKTLQEPLVLISVSLSGMSTQMAKAKKAPARTHFKMWSGMS